MDPAPSILRALVTVLHEKGALDAKEVDFVEMAAVELCVDESPVEVCDAGIRAVREALLGIVEREAPDWRRTQLPRAAG